MNERALALLDLLESDFGQSGKDVRFLAIRDELTAAYRLGLTRAAEICKSEEVDYASIGAQDDLAYNTAIEHAMAAILTERDQKEKT